MLLPLNILKVTPFKVTLVLQTLGPYTTGKEADLEVVCHPELLWIHSRQRWWV